jgi:hypothetical protein
VVTRRCSRSRAWAQLLTQAILRRDYPMVQGGLLLVATFLVLLNILVDVLYAVLDPRVRYDEALTRAATVAPAARAIAARRDAAPAAPPPAVRHRASCSASSPALGCCRPGSPPWSIRAPVDAQPLPPPRRVALRHRQFRPLAVAAWSGARSSR